MKRFYKLVSQEKTPGGFHILLDGKAVKTPSGKALFIPNAALANEAQREWAGQDKEIIPDSMPVTQILVTTQDRVAEQRTEIEKSVLAYLDTDLLCYRAPKAEPIAAYQAKAWDQWLVWFEKTYGVVLKTTDSLTALRQPDAAHKRAAQAVSKMDDLRFCVLQLVVALSGSLILGFAFVTGDASADEVERATLAEDLYKAEIYREHIHGAAPLEEKKRAALRRDLQAASIVLQSLK